MSVNSHVHFAHALVIETNLYAGNFERPLCAYATGSYGECGVGDEEADIFLTEAPEQFKDLGDYTESMPDDRGCWRPTSIWNSEDKSGYQEVIIFFADLPSDEGLAYIAERVRAFPAYWAGTRWGAKDLEILSIKLVKREVKIVDTELQAL